MAIEPLRQFAKDSMHLVKKCTKPDRKEFMAIAKATGVGFGIMGFIGFFVKLIHIPINNILVGLLPQRGLLGFDRARGGPLLRPGVVRGDGPARCVAAA